MSYTFEPLKAIKDFDPRVDFEEKRVWAVKTGGSQVSWKPVQSTSVSNSSIQFSAPPY